MRRASAAAAATARPGLAGRGVALFSFIGPPHMDTEQNDDYLYASGASGAHVRFRRVPAAAVLQASEADRVKATSTVHAGGAQGQARPAQAQQKGGWTRRKVKQSYNIVKQCCVA